MDMHYAFKYNKITITEICINTNIRYVGEYKLKFKQSTIKKLGERGLGVTRDNIYSLVFIYLYGLFTNTLSYFYFSISLSSTKMVGLSVLAMVIAIVVRLIFEHLI